MVVHYFHVFSACLRPTKTDAPLIIDADAVLTDPLAPEFFQAIAGRHPHKDRVTTFWLAPKLDYLPVQMEQTEPGKATISLVLLDIKFDTPNSK